jgi:4-diphosphocytidyl-2-C-methyl-D-erythritol kinase
LILFPNCKINLGLHILRKREDGYHDLQTVFYPLPLQDALEVVRHPSPMTDIEFTASGLTVQGNLSDNICFKAYHLIKQDFPDLPPIKLHLHKTIPMGAGLGGGSADGAFMLLLLNKKFNLGIDEKGLIRYALLLGSDCPFFIKNTPSFATGRGEILEDCPIDLPEYQFVVVNPGIHVPTGWAFSQITPSADRPLLKEIIRLPVENWKEGLTNDFEAPVSQHHPEIATIKQTLYEQGAVYASMSGSGSTVFGIFPKSGEPLFSFPAHYFVKFIPSSLL